MSTEERFKLITRNLEEVLTEQELKSLIESKTPLKHYIGYEISGKVHLGQGLFTMMKIKDLQEAGVQTTILIADWHTWLNKKLDGNLETIKKLGRSYFEEALKAGALCVGANPDNIEFVLGSELYDKLGSDYWATVVRVAKGTTLSRMIRSTTIMGRMESEVTDSAMLIYPSMQSADIFMMNINIAHAGTDQRNVHIVARDVAEKLGYQKPIAIHGHLLLGLSKPIEMILDDVKKQSGPGVGNIALSEEDKTVLIENLKMSKSKPDSAIFIHDDSETIKRKINQAYAPEGVVEFNPILDWVKHLIFYEENTTFVVKRDEKWGEDLTYTSYADLDKDYADKKLHPQDLKMAVAEWLIKKLEPARKYFEDPAKKAALDEIERLTSRST